MKIVLKLLFVFIIITSCSNDDKNIEKDNCNADTPIEDISWLKAKKEAFEKLMGSTRIEIHSYFYNNETVFLIDDCMSCADALTVIYNCSGEKICEFGGIDGRNTCPDFKDKATNKKLLWRNYNNLIIDKDRYDNANSDYHYEIKNVSIKEDFLTITISSSGCDGSSWNIDLIDSSDVLESNPSKRELKIELINKEVCLAIVEKEIVYDISKLQVKDMNSIILNIDTYQNEIKYNY